MKRVYDESGLPSGANARKLPLTLLVALVAAPFLYIAFGEQAINFGQERGLIPVKHDDTYYIGVTFDDEPETLHLKRLDSLLSHSYCRTEQPIDWITGKPDEAYGEHKYELVEGECPEDWIPAHWALL